MGGTNCAPRLLSRARNLDGIAGLMVLNLKAQKFVHGGNGVGVFRRDADARLGPCFRACIGSPGAAASWSPRPGDFARGSGHARGSLQSREARERAWGDRPTAWQVMLNILGQLDFYCHGGSPGLGHLAGRPAPISLA